MDYNIFEGLTSATNPSVLRAREDLDNLRKARIEKEKVVQTHDLDDEEIIASRIDNWPDMLHCNHCRREKVSQKYNKYSMMHNVYRVKQKTGKITIVITHLCPEHADNYVPNPGRRGNINE